MTDSSKEYKHSYSEISDKRSDIRKRFPGLEHQAFREWPGCENIEEYNALIFGSGDVKAENALILKKSCKSITTIDSDPTAGADHLSLFDVEEKARSLFECIPPNFYQFKIEYLWLEHLGWQVEPIKKFFKDFLSEN